MNPYRFRVSFRIWHPALASEDVEASLKLKARHKWTVGMPRRTTAGETLDGSYDATYCSFDMEGGENDLPGALSRSLERLQPHAAALHRLTDTGGRLEFFVGWFFEGSPGEEFPAALLAELGKLHINLSMAFYPGEE